MLEIERINLGKVVAERTEDGFLVMLPDGRVFSSKTKTTVTKRVKAWPINRLLSMVFQF